MPARMEAACSNSGAAFLQWPHQGAEDKRKRTIELDEPELLGLQDALLEVGLGELEDRGIAIVQGTGAQDQQSS